MLGPLIALAVAALQPALSLQPAGVWEGTVGTLPVRACFVARGDELFGAYYYRERLRLIPLLAGEGARGGFSEGTSDAEPATWRIAQAGPDRLTGQWTGGGQSLPVQLRRVAAPAGEAGACVSLDFHRPLLADIRTETARATTDGTEFTRLTLDTRERYSIRVLTFALDGDSPAIGRINAALRAPLDGDPPRWFECVSSAMENGPNSGDYQDELTPAMISRRWLSVSYMQGGFCGGAHPDGSSTYRLFDLNSGAELNLHDWFNASAVRRERLEGAREESRTLLAALRDAVLGSWRPQEEECGEVIRNADYWTIGLTRDGFQFAPLLPHAAMVCEEEWTIGFDRLRPFLTPEAAAHVAALRAERR